MNRISVFTFLMILLTAGSCNIINPTEPVPTYIHIDSFNFAKNPAFGSSSHDIKVVYVYLNSQSIGIFDLPVTFPVILDKPGKILVTPGVYSNGVTGTPIQYPYYTSDTFTLTPNPGQIVTPKLTAGYYNFTKVPFYVDFDGGAPGASFGRNPFILLSGNTHIDTTATPGEVFEGAHSGRISFTNGKDSSENVTSLPVTLTPNTDIYLELDYKCSVPFTVGLSTTVGTTPQYAYLVGFYPTTKWKKAYIALRTFVSTYQATNKLYYLLLRSFREGSADGYVLLDNIKIVSQ